MHLLLLIVCLFVFLACYAIYRSLMRISVAGIPGPKSGSWLLGNLPELFGGQVGEAEFKWQEIYGGVVRIKASFGEDRLLVTDPKALQYIYQTSGYRFHKQPERIELTRLISGRGVLWADGEDHKRHRKVMLPGFGTPEAKALLPLFFSYAAQIGTKWKDIIGATADQSAVLDVTAWASRATLDAIGSAAFDYQFGAMDNADNLVGSAYSNVFMDTFGSPANASLLALSLLHYLPRGIREFLVDHVPSTSLRHIRYTAKVTTSVARDLVASKSAALLQGKGSRDIMSLLVKANASENEKTRLSEDELLSQMRTIIMAGHETTANSFSWAVLELARQPRIQARLRSEIRTMEKTLHARGSCGFSPADMDAMPYLCAVVKEVLRFHPVSFNNFRQSAADDVLPLSRPFTLRSGEVVTELPVPRGMKVIISIAAYNRNKDVFGPDAHTFNPERWLNGALGKPHAPVGVYANLCINVRRPAVRSCMGWRFAVLELQAFLIELVSDFEFSLTPEAMRIRREACIVMVPTVGGAARQGHAAAPAGIRRVEGVLIDSLSLSFDLLYL
ncbi:cytochrome P450 [Mycena rebaudengoi]|nr:cytochrome P450 [Mycena rebaudengoi]